MNQPFARVALFALASTCAAGAGLAQKAPRSEPLAAPTADIKYAAPTTTAAFVTETRPPVDALGPVQVEHRSDLASAVRTGGADHTNVYLDTDASGTVWARGANYKMRFDASSADFVPFFGSDAPRNFELQLALTSASCGAAEIALDHAAAPHRADTAVSFDRGDVEERYELSPRGVEQKFVFESLPATGELRVRVGVKSELAAEVDATGWRFGNEYGYVHYGKATAIDAAGRSFALEGQLVAGALEFSVPAAFIARAEMPLVIDPWIAGYSIEYGAITSLSPDVVYDGSGGYVMHCWEEIYSAADHDVYSVISDVYGNVVAGTAVYIDYTSANWQRPRCAYQTVSDHYIITAQVGAPGNRAIFCLVRSPYAGFNSGQVLVSDAGNPGEKYNADVGGDPYMGAAYFCVVYQRAYSAVDHDIHARLVDGNGVVAGSTIYVDNSSGTLDTAPAISKTNDTTDWNIVWQRDMPAGNKDIFGARVHWQGAQTAATFAIPSTSYLDDSNPSVSGPQRGTSRYVVAHERMFLSDHDIELTLMDGTTALQQINLSTTEGSSFPLDQIQPSVECDGSHFACAYAQQWSSGSTSHTSFLTEISPTGNELFVVQNHQLLSVSGDDDTHIALAAPCSSNQSNIAAQYVATWSAIGAGHSDIDVAVFNGMSGGAITWFCGGTAATCPCGNGNGSGGGCGNSAAPSGGILSPAGAASTTNDTLTLYYQFLPPNVSALLFQGVSTINSGAGTVFGDGRRCIAAPVFRFPIRAVNASGYALYGYAAGDTPISVAGSVPYFGVTMNYQVWFRDNANFCTVANTNLTNALSVHWTP